MKPIEHNGYYLYQQLYMNGVELTFRGSNNQYLAIKETDLLAILYKSGIFHSIKFGYWDEYIKEQCEKGVQ